MKILKEKLVQILNICRHHEQDVKWLSYARKQLLQKANFETEIKYIHSDSDKCPKCHIIYGNTTFMEVKDV